MTGYRPLIDLDIIFFVALVAGLMAYRFRQPLLFAYLVGGIAIGPHGLGIVRQPETISIFAEIGVTLLMFALGVEFSLRSLLAVRAVAIQGGLLQIGATILLGLALGKLLGFDTVAALVLGAALSLSSTMIVMKTLMDRGEIDSSHGRVMLGILIVQDLAVVAILALLPVLPGLSIARLPALGQHMLKAAAYLVLAVVLARGVIPPVMRYVASTQYKELFALTVVGVCFSTALLTLSLGFSLALGAFVAGLIVSESEYRHEVFAEVIPLRDVFAILFFVSVGMLIDPAFFIRSFWQIALVVVTILFGKSAITSSIVRVFGYHPRTAFLAGVGVAQIGEFSFLLALQAVNLHLISTDLYGIILSAALLTILFTPSLLAYSPMLYQRIADRLSIDGTAERAEAEAHPPLHEHVILIGYGRVGKNLGASLLYFGIPFVVIDYNQAIIDGLHAAGIPAIFGDGSIPAVLQHAHPETARLTVVSTPEFLTTRLAVNNLRRRNPDLHIVVRVTAEGNIHQLSQEGADEVIQPEFEAGIEITRHALVRLGVSLPEVQEQTERLRRIRYGEVLAPAQPTAAELREHFIICGYGRLGRRISQELVSEHLALAIVEKDPDRVAGNTPPGVPVLIGDATDESILHRAGVEKAQGLVAVTSSDTDNLYLTATARQLNPQLFILARISQDSEADKFRRAGADRVISPYTLGARRMATEILHPHLAEFLELAASDSAGPWGMRQVRIAPTSPLAGKALEEIGAPGVTVMGVVTREGAILSHPGPGYEVEAGDVLVAVGSDPDLARLRQTASGSIPR